MEEERNRFLPLSTGKFHLSLQQGEETPLSAPFDFKKIFFQGFSGRAGAAIQQDLLPDARRECGEEPVLL